MAWLTNVRSSRGLQIATACCLCGGMLACGDDGVNFVTTTGATPSSTDSAEGGAPMSTTTGGTTSGSTTTGQPVTTTGTNTGGTTEGGSGDATTTGSSTGGTTTSDAGLVADAGTGDAGNDGGDVEPARMPPCIDDENEVVLIGDSYVDWISHTFVADMRAEAGQNWPSYAVGGTSMATGGIGPIPEQLDTALADNPNIKMVVMTGGGNDILVPDTGMFPEGGQCTSTPDAPMIPDCQAIVEKALDAAEDLMVKAADAGITDTVYFFYPHIPGGGLISGPHPNEMLDYALPRAREVCESALETTGGRMQCHFVDMVPVFAGKTGLFADLFSEAGDGVHPNSEGSKVMAQEIWRVMQDACLAQPSGSGCCREPEP